MALWPVVPTGGTPQRMSLGCCDQADEPAAPIAKMTANAVSARLSMALFLLGRFRSLTGKRSSVPARVDAYRCGAQIASNGET